MLYHKDRKVILSSGVWAGQTGETDTYEKEPNSAG